MLPEEVEIQLCAEGHVSVNLEQVGCSTEKTVRSPSVGKEQGVFKGMKACLWA